MKVMLPAGGPYGLGLLTQSCSKCKWTDEKLRLELETCPRCHAPVAGACVLRLGGVQVEYEARRNCFHVRCAYGGEPAEIAEVETPDVLKFMLRHFRDWVGDIQPLEEIGQLRGKGFGCAKRFKRVLDGERFEEELVDAWNEMNNHYGDQIENLWAAVQQLVGFVQRQHFTKLADARQVAIAALRNIQNGDVKQAQAVLMQLEDKLVP